MGIFFKVYHLFNYFSDRYENLKIHIFHSGKIFITFSDDSNFIS